MADHTAMIQSIVSGVLTGGASAATALFAFFKDIKSRLAELEAKVGSDKTDPKTGLYYTLELIQDGARRTRREIDGWRDDPPEWLTRAIQNASRRSSVTMEHQHEMEERVEQRLKAFSQQLRRFEEELHRRQEELNRREEMLERSSPATKTFITRDEYEEDSLRRAAEVSKIRENMAASNVWLRGVMAALGYGDDKPSIPPIQKPLGLPTKRKIPHGDDR